jgi:hypothetical protein
MTRYLEAPHEFTGPEPSLFLAGGITGTFDWQTEIVRLLGDAPLVVLNPRRRNFPMDDPTAARSQIEWEFRHLRRATVALFWFPCETLCPIALYELGGRATTTQPFFVGTHPDYQRKLDVTIQLKLARPEVRVVHSLREMAEQVKNWILARPP